jgi:hypothetical protein
MLTPDVSLNYNLLLCDSPHALHVLPQHLSVFLNTIQPTKISYAYFSGILGTLSLISLQTGRGISKPSPIRAYVMPPIRETARSWGAMSKQVLGKVAQRTLTGSTIPIPFPSSIQTSFRTWMALTWPKTKVPVTVSGEPGGVISWREYNSHSIENALSLTRGGFTKVFGRECWYWLVSNRWGSSHLHFQPWSIPILPIPLSRMERLC